MLAAEFNALVLFDCCSLVARYQDINSCTRGDRESRMHEGLLLRTIGFRLPPIGWLLLTTVGLLLTIGWLLLTTLWLFLTTSVTRQPVVQVAARCPWGRLLGGCHGGVRLWGGFLHILLCCGVWRVGLSLIHI